ncbi:MAG: hypothetical protein EB084_06450 [Proteobacteria bacterium]|nr:hypothetical protein [Pseudomonadota bacterium]
MSADVDLLTPLEKRLQAAEQQLETTPDDVLTLADYGEAALLRGRLHEAMKCFQRLSALEPENLSHCLGLGRAYLESGLHAEAHGIAQRVMREEQPPLAGHLLLRTLARTSHQTDQALAAWVAAHASWLPERDAVEAERSRLAEVIGQLEREVEHLMARSKEDANEPVLAFSMCLARERQDRVRESLGIVEAWAQQYDALDTERQRQEDEERLRLEEAARLQRAEEEQREREEQERARLQAEEEERQLREEQERARLQAEEEERQRREAEEAQRGTREREQAYTALKGQLDPLIASLLKTKGVTAALLVARDGFLVHEGHTAEVDIPTLMNFVVGAQAALSTYEKASWKTWVLELAKGILVLHRITPDYFLVIHGVTGANFGLLTLFIDKNRGQLESAFASAPAVS